MGTTEGAKNDAQKVKDIIQDAGGRVVGRTRLQKIAFFLEMAGVGEGFTFSYKHYGPFSEELAEGASLASILGLITENVHPSSWGGTYSEYTTSSMDVSAVEPTRKGLLEVMASAGAIQLELAATAALLASEGESDPWGETARRKPEKVGNGRLENAKDLYSKLLQVKTPKKLPQLVQ